MENTMHYSEVCLESFGYHLPEQAITSEEIECKLSRLYEHLRIPKGRLEALTGIKERKIWPSGTLPSDIASEAGKKALENCHLNAQDIDLVIFTGVCRNALEPSTANVVHHNLKLSPHCMSFDISNACIGFLNGMTVAANMIEMKQVRNALIVTGENAAPLYDNILPKLSELKDEEMFRNSLASLTLGSAAVAFVMTHKDISKNQHKLIGGVGQCDSSGHNLCIGNGDTRALSMQTDTVNLMKKGLILSQITWELFKRKIEWDNTTPDHILTHQISQSHHNKCFELLKLQQEKGYCFIENLGNTGSAAAPLSLALAHEQGHFKAKDKIALLGIGSGLNTLMLGIKW